MVLIRKIRSVQELQALCRLACSVPEEVWLRSPGGETVVDAKSAINLFCLDYSRPVELVTDSEEVLQAMTERERVPATA